MKTITEQEALEMYDEMLDEFSSIEIGSLSYVGSLALKRLDPIAYDVGFTDYTDYLYSDGILVEGFTD